MVEQMETKKFKKESGLAGLLGMFAKVLPVTLVQSLGGPVVAGMIVAVTGGVVVGVPAAYLGVKAVSVGTPTKKSVKKDAFSKFFGEQRSAIENISPEAAARAKALAEEEARSDEETSLGLLIPEELPGGKKEEAREGVGEQKQSVLASGKEKLDPEQLAKWKSRFGSSGAEGAGAGGGMQMASAGGGQTTVGKQTALGGVGAAMGAGGGTGMARGKKTSVKSTKALKGKQTGGYEGLKGAAKMVSRGAGMGDQLASGQTGAGFGELGRAGVVAGGPIATVGGIGGLGQEGGVSSPDPSAGMRPSGGGGGPSGPEKHISHPYSGTVNLIKGLLAAAALTGIILLWTAPTKGISPGWWAGFAAGLVSALVALGLAMKLLAGDDFAQAIAWRLLGPTAIMLGIYGYLGSLAGTATGTGTEAVKVLVGKWLKLAALGTLLVGSSVASLFLGSNPSLTDKYKTECPDNKCSDNDDALGLHW